jgi:hypothetical protein
MLHASRVDSVHRARQARHRGHTIIPCGGRAQGSGPHVGWSAGRGWPRCFLSAKGLVSASVWVKPETYAWYGVLVVVPGLAAARSVVDDGVEGRCRIWFFWTGGSAKLLLYFHTLVVRSYHDIAP